MNQTWNEETIEAAKQEVINAVDAGEKCKAFCNLYNVAATVEYLNNTTKAKADIDYSEMSAWADDCTGTEWESVEDCVMCAGIAAGNVLEREANED